MVQKHIIHDAQTGVTKVVDYTAEEQKVYDDYQAKSGERKLAKVKGIRLEKLKETDYLALGDVTIPDNIKTWRQTLRDIPQDHTNEAAYDLLLARTDGELTHSVWTKP
jgi:hypothetical protein